MFYPIILVLMVAAYGIYSLPEVKGLIGEVVVKLALLFLPDNQYIIMNDIYIPAYDGLYTQIDHLIVAACGVIVIETKNYSGKLTGNSRKKYWMAYKDGEYYKAYNPIRQNSYHIKMLKDNCPGIKGEKIYSIICLSFGVKANIETRTPIIGPLGLRKTITAFNRNSSKHPSKINLIAKMISEITIDKKTASVRHRRMLALRKERFRKGICPRCNAKLLRKRGVKGEYLICSNYPVCKFRASNAV